jgi:hypothetical protein
MQVPFLQAFAIDVRGMNPKTKTHCRGSTTESCGYVMTPAGSSVILMVIIDKEHV